jgi:O-acetyl-ADP-ribose deacetylase (regulator of RNase III)
MGEGVCGAIFRAAGASRLQAACDKLSPVKMGEAVMTPGFDLPAKYVIHAAGPVYRRSDAGRSEQCLCAAYVNALKLAVEKKCESIAFPLISSGIYGYPKDEALRVATSAIRDFLADHDMDVYLVVFDRKAFEVSRKMLGEVASYIDEHYVGEGESTRRKLLHVESEALQECDLLYSVQKADETLFSAPMIGIDDLIGNLDEPFSQALFRLIDSKGKTDVEVYKRANLDRKLFSKIRTGKGYVPSKRTAIALAVALELTLDETDDLLKRAGYTLSHSQKFDVIVEYFIANGRYDIFQINEVLFSYDLQLLGG